MGFVKSIVKRMIPPGLIRYVRRSQAARLRRINRNRSIKDVFTSIYEEHEWGGAEKEFYSGTGSSSGHASRYTDVVNPLIVEKGAKTLVDLGCGDYTVGRELRKDGGKYIGIDIVESLIKRNKEAYGDDKTSFMCIDMVADPLPDGDFCMIRQVLQHLSNSEIDAVLKKTRKYRYVLITEHYPAPSVKSRPNLDKVHGSDTRILDNSAVYLDQPPFNVKPESITLVLDVDAEIPLVHQGERIKTFLIDNGPGAQP